MNRSEIILKFKDLESWEQDQLMQELKVIHSSSDYKSVLKSRGDILDNKGGECPHCGGFKYSKYGRDKGSRRYICLECNRTFTEYTGTWIAGIHNKEIIPKFLETIQSELSLIKTSEKLHINEGTAFRWRHKFLSSVETSDNIPFKGITESDETFFLESQKGTKCTHREPRRRGGGSKKGINNELATVITTMDRLGNSELKFSNMGRISEVDIDKTIGNKISERTILCSDGHNSYKAFTKSYNIEHHIVIASKKLRVKGKFHIQHINSLHSRIKSFFNIRRKGVSTKYLQKYLNWQKIKDKFKDSDNWIKNILRLSLKHKNAEKVFANIQKDFNEIYY